MKNMINTQGFCVLIQIQGRLLSSLRKLMLEGIYSPVAEAQKYSDQVCAYCEQWAQRGTGASEIVL